MGNPQNSKKNETKQQAVLIKTPRCHQGRKPAGLAQ